jgi:hypothetical protein
MRTSATVHAPWRVVLQHLLTTLRQRRFQARRTFDLQLARQLLKKGESGLCPRHGAAPCNCQYLVLHVNGPDRAPSVVVIHGHDSMTTISFLTGNSDEARRDMSDAMNEALEHLHTAGPAIGGTEVREAGSPRAHRLESIRGRGARNRAKQ